MQQLKQIFGCRDIAQKHRSRSFVIAPAVVAGATLLVPHLPRQHRKEER
jgi:hypothetical protein